MNSTHANNTLKLLADVAKAHEKDIGEYPPDLTRNSDSKDEIPPNPVLKALFNTIGNSGIVKMTNMTLLEIRELFECCGERINEEWKGSKRDPRNYSLMDVFIMVLATFKSGLTWFFLGLQFGMNAATVER